MDAHRRDDHPSADDVDRALQERLTAVPEGVQDVFVHPVLAWIITLGLVALCTWWISWMRVFSGYGGHPNTILYLIPVAVGAAFLGVRGGIITTVLVLMVAHVYLLNDAGKHGLAALFSQPDLHEGIELMSLTMGTLAIAAVTGRLRWTLVELRSANARLELANGSLAAANRQLIESERLRRDFNRDVLLAVTAGKLRLVEYGELPGPDLADREAALSTVLKEPIDATMLRQAINRMVQALGMERDRAGDLMTCVTEAATNAIKHANGGEARVWTTQESVSVLISDHGDGIAPTHLARATLEKGYSTRISLGMGFNMMLETCDALSLCTGEMGTSVLIFMETVQRGTEEERILARYLK